MRLLETKNGDCEKVIAHVRLLETIRYCVRREVDRIQPKILKGSPTGPERNLKPHIESPLLFHRYSVKSEVHSEALIYTGIRGRWLQ